MYKDKVLMTLALLAIFFGWLISQNITNVQRDSVEYLQDMPDEYFRELHRTPVRDIPVIVQDTIAQRVDRCRASRQCRRMAEAIVYEARSEPIEGQYAIAFVILNRVDSRRWPNTVEGVITQPKQFSYLEDMHTQNPPDRKDWTQAYLVAYNAINGEVLRDTEATHYLNPNVLTRLPRWARIYPKLMVIGNHHFYASN